MPGIFIVCHLQTLAISLVVANITLGEMQGWGSSLLGGGLELGILSVLVSKDFSKIDLVRSPPSLTLPYPPTSIKVNL